MKTDNQTTEWLEFCEWRQAKLNDWYASNESRDLDERLLSLYTPERKRFLFWEWDSYIDPSIIHLMQEKLRLLREAWKPYVPEETYEEFLNWKAGKYD